jgi:hypothetical protein
MLNSELVYKELANDSEKNTIIEKLRALGGTFENRVSNSKEWAGLKDLDKKFNKTYSFADTQKLLEDFMANFDNEALLALFAHELDLYQEHALYSTPVSNFSSGALSSIYIFDGENIRLSLASILPTNLIFNKNKDSKRGKGFTVIGYDTLLTFINSKHTVVEEYAVDANAEKIEGIPTRLESTPTVHDLRSGDSLFMPGGQQAMTFISTDGPVTYLDLSIKHTRIAAFPQYQADTKELHGLQCSSVESSRLQVMSVALRSMQAQESIATLEQLLDHHDYHVRWHVVREIYGISKEAAKPYLAEMAKSDSSSQVRQAAQTALASMEE